MQFIRKFSDINYKSKLIHNVSIGLGLLYITLIFCIFLLPFWINKYDEFIKKVWIVVIAVMNLLAVITIIILSRDKILNKYLGFFCLITWIVFNIIEVMIWVYKWMLEDKNTNGIPRTQLIITIIFGILSFIAGKLWQ